VGPIRKLVGALMSHERPTTLALRAAYAGKYDAFVAAHPFHVIPDRRDLHHHVMTLVAGGGPITYLEFGVHKGESLRWWVEGNHDPSSRFRGFDSFEGLPEDWNARYRKGHFSTGRMPPSIDDPRCGFEVGWFQNTLPKFLQSDNLHGRVVVHLDADLYSSTLLVLFALAPVLKRGDVLIFDDFTDTLHVFRALNEFLSAYPLRLRPLARSARMRVVAVEIDGSADGIVGLPVERSASV
jgi:hypothetical protein